MFEKGLGLGKRKRSLLCIYMGFGVGLQIYLQQVLFFKFEKKMSCGGDMCEETSKDPGIKLFGRTIPLPECQIQPNSQLMVHAITMILIL